MFRPAKDVCNETTEKFKQSVNRELVTRRKALAESIETAKELGTYYLRVAVTECRTVEQFDKLRDVHGSYGHIVLDTDKYKQSATVDVLMDELTALGYRISRHEGHTSGVYSTCFIIDWKD